MLSSTNMSTCRQTNTLTLVKLRLQVKAIRAVPLTKQMIRTLLSINPGLLGVCGKADVGVTQHLAEVTIQLLRRPDWVICGGIIFVKIDNFSLNILHF